MLLFHAPPDGARGIEVTSGLEQRYEPDRRVRVAAPARPLQRRVGTRDIPAGRKEHAEAERRGWMAGCVGECVGAFCAGHVTASFEQATEVERAVRVAALACALVAGLRLLEIAALFKEDSEVRPPRRHVRAHLPADTRVRRWSDHRPARAACRG